MPLAALPKRFFQNEPFICENLLKSKEKKNLRGILWLLLRALWAVFGSDCSSEKIKIK